MTSSAQARRLPRGALRREVLVTALRREVGLRRMPRSGQRRRRQETGIETGIAIAIVIAIATVTATAIDATTAGAMTTTTTGATAATGATIATGIETGIGATATGTGATTATGTGALIVTATATVETTTAAITIGAIGEGHQPPDSLFHPPLSNPTATPRTLKCMRKYVSLGPGGVDWRRRRRPPNCHKYIRSYKYMLFFVDSGFCGGIWAKYRLMRPLERVRERTFLGEIDPRHYHRYARYAYTSFTHIYRFPVDTETRNHASERACVDYRTVAGVLGRRTRAC